MEQPVELRDPVLYLILADHLAAGDGYRYGFERRPGADRVLPARLPVGARWGAVAGSVALPGTVSTFDVAIWLNVALSVATIGLVFVLGRRLAGPAVGLVAAAHLGGVAQPRVPQRHRAHRDAVPVPARAAARSWRWATASAARAPGVARLVDGRRAVRGLVLLVRPVSAVIAPVLPGAVVGAGRQGGAVATRVVGVATLVVLVPVVDPQHDRDGRAGGPVAQLRRQPLPRAQPGRHRRLRRPRRHCFTAEGLRRPEAETRRNPRTSTGRSPTSGSNPGTTLRRTPSKLRIHARRTTGTASRSPRTSVSSRSFSDSTRGTAPRRGHRLLRRRGRARRRRRASAAPAAPRRHAGGVPDRRRRWRSCCRPLATFGDPRFKMPLYPTLAICAAVALVALWDRRAPATRARGAAPASAVRGRRHDPGDGAGTAHVVAVTVSGVGRRPDLARRRLRRPRHGA